MTPKLKMGHCGPMGPPKTQPYMVNNYYGKVLNFHIHLGRIGYLTQTRIWNFSPAPAFYLKILNDEQSPHLKFIELLFDLSADFPENFKFVCSIFSILRI